MEDESILHLRPCSQLLYSCTRVVRAGFTLNFLQLSNHERENGNSASFANLALDLNSNLMLRTLVRAVLLRYKRKKPFVSHSNGLLLYHPRFSGHCTTLHVMKPPIRRVFEEGFKVLRAQSQEKSPGGKSHQGYF